MLRQLFYFLFFLFGRVHKPLKPFRFTKLCLFIYNCFACLCIFIGFALSIDSAFFIILPLTRQAKRIIAFAHYTWSAGVCFSFFVLSRRRYFDTNIVKALPKSTKKEKFIEITYIAISVVFCFCSGIYMFIFGFLKTKYSVYNCFYGSSTVTTESNTNITVNGTEKHWNGKLQCFLAMNNILCLFNIIPTLLVCYIGTFCIFIIISTVGAIYI